MNKHYDYVIIGAGITGLTIAYELIQSNQDARIAIIEKEAGVGFHGSGRNSGVLHSGIYYPEDSLKAKFCAEGAKLMKEFCQLHKIPINQIGKVIVPTMAEQDSQIDLLFNRGINNKAKIEIIDAKTLREIEPYAKSASGRALFSPKTAIVDPKLVLLKLVEILKESSVDFYLNTKIEHAEPDISAIILTNNVKLIYNKLVNAAGQYADKIAHMFGVGLEYTMVPFKGTYYKLNPASKIKLQRLIYPVPDLNMPFLGIHSVNDMTGNTYFGPSSLPAFGRENYSGIEGVHGIEAIGILNQLIKLYFYNNNNFRNYAHIEGLKFIKSEFTKSAQLLVPKVRKNELLKSNKVGIRAQLINIRKNTLEMDFIIESSKSCLHVLNGISPGFTCGFAFSKFLVERLNDVSSDYLN